MDWSNIGTKLLDSLYHHHQLKVNLIVNEKGGKLGADGVYKECKGIALMYHIYRNEYINIELICAIFMRLLGL